MDTLLKCPHPRSAIQVTADNNDFYVYCNACGQDPRDDEVDEDESEI